MLKRTVSELYNGTPSDQVLATFREQCPSTSAFVTGVYKVRGMVLDMLPPLPCPALEVYRSHPAVADFLDSTTRRGQVTALSRMPEEARALVPEALDPVSGFHVTPEEVKEKKAADALALQTKVNTALVIEGAGAMIDYATSLLQTETKSMSRMGVCLLMLTGRRMAEIMGNATFEYVNEHCAMFKGQLKTKGQERDAYPIPLLAPFHVIKAGIEKLRAKQARMKPVGSVSERYHGMLRRELLNLFPRAQHIHVLRSMYVRCVFEKYRCECAFPGLAKAALGHCDLHETLFYSATHITGFERHAGTGPRLCIVDGKVCGGE